MKSQLATLLLACALVFSAASPLATTEDFVSGFAHGLEFENFNFDISNCSTALNNLTANFKSVVAAALANPSESGKLIKVLSDDFGIAAQSCVESALTVNDLSESVRDQLAGLNQAYVMIRLLLNKETYQRDLATMHDALNTGSFYQAGQSVADLFKITVYGSSSIPTRTVRQLNEGDIISIGLDVILTIQGFLEGSNTTISTNDFQNCANNAVGLVMQLPTLEQALASQNVSQIAAAVGAVATQFSTFDIACTIFKNEVVSYYNYILPYLENSTALETAFEALVGPELPDTLDNIAQAIRDERQQNFEGLGTDVGKIWNQFATVLTQ